MLRKTIFALATIATVTAAAAVPASAHWKGHGHGFWRGGLGFGSIVVIEESCYRWWRGVLVNVCR